MKNDIFCAMLFGCMIGATIATFCKPTQNIIKKGANLLKEETENVFNKKQDGDK